MGLFNMLFGVSTLLGAIESGDKEKAKNLILQGVDVNEKARLSGATPLFAACIRNYQDIAELLLSRGADVNNPLSVGTTTLHYMAKHSDNRSLDIVRLLLSKGAKIDTEDRDGRSPLHSACENKDHSIAELLIQSGADIHKKIRQGATPLHFAVNAGHAVLVRLLLDKGANVNDAKNIEGVTPLHMAVVNGDAEITKLLLSKHADISAKDKNGRTPLQLAASISDSAHLAIQDILRQAARARVINTRAEPPAALAQLAPFGIKEGDWSMPETQNTTFCSLVGKLPDAGYLRQFFGVQDGPNVNATHILLVDLLICALWFSLLYPLWIYPVLHGVEEAKRNGVSPKWMWFGIHPLFGWITYLIIQTKTTNGNDHSNLHPNVPTTSANLDPKAIVDDYVNRTVGITHKTLNIRAAIGIIVFGWLMKMNYDDLGKKGLGWAFLLTIAFVFAIALQVEPMVGIIGPVIYVAAWVHTNAILTEKRRIAREQYFKEKSTDKN